MNEQEVFRVDYPNGYMEIKVGVFFGTADARKIKKFLKLARQNGDDSQRELLVAKLHNEVKRCKDTLESCRELDESKRNLISEFFGHEQGMSKEPTTHEKAIAKQSKKLLECAKALAKVRWD